VEKPADSADSDEEFRRSGDVSTGEKKIGEGGVRGDFIGVESCRGG
jgi:hypothetical protein